MFSDETMFGFYPIQHSRRIGQQCNLSLD